MPQRLQGVNLHLVDSFAEVENFLTWLSEDRNRQWLGVDTETGGFDWWREPIRLIQFGDMRDGWAIPYDRWAGVADEVFSRIPHNGHTRFVAHNAKFDQEFLIHNGFDTPPMDDTMAAVYLLEPHKAKGLKPAAARRIDSRAMSGQQGLDLAMKKAKWTWATVPWDFPLYWQYAALDTVLTAHLADDVIPQVERLYGAAYSLQLQSDTVLRKMEMHGMRIDREYCEQEQERLTARFTEIVSWFLREHHVDPMKSQQLVKFFWDQGIEITMTTEGGAPSVSKESLESIDHPLVGLILEARSAQKMSNTYFANLLEYSDDDGILHPNVNPLGAKTGRMSINRPALQTLPRKKLVRNAFIPRDGNRLICADYQGQEMRVFAAFCGDRHMLEAYQRGEDLHNYTASEIYGAGFTKPQRQTAKNGGFSKIYGAGIAKFAATCGIPYEEGAAFLKRWDQLFPRAKPFQAEVISKIMQRAREEGTDVGWVQTLAGRHVPVEVRQAYKGINYLVQGSCSDILRQALVDLDDAGIADQGLVLPVHDETVFDVAAAEAEDLAHEMAVIMENAAFDLPVPMVVETDILDRWGDKYPAELVTRADAGDNVPGARGKL